MQWYVFPPVKQEVRVQSPEGPILLQVHSMETIVAVEATNNTYCLQNTNRKVPAAMGKYCFFRMLSLTWQIRQKI